ncbi:hypothetical protein E2C01_053166 [Portunus trituberculatus]|uniref:Uncharacterized protein n=1 Tax=Portunus trituberculatus TaxID=210409 RepID=A0A5B7GGD0_PORTR|nr:hypothetical protein [Portunus trituberculatus]
MPGGKRRCIERREAEGVGVRWFWLSKRTLPRGTLTHSLPYPLPQYTHMHTNNITHALPANPIEVCQQTITQYPLRLAATCPLYSFQYLVTHGITPHRATSSSDPYVMTRQTSTPAFPALPSREA